MTPLDYWIIGGYLLLVVGVSIAVALRQESTDDYYVAGRQLSGGYIAASILATQVSAVSLIGGPAFVALGGGLVWLQYELAIPLATIILIAVVVPVLRRGRFTTIYEYAGRRFGPTARLSLALVFLIARALASGVVLYAVALPLSLAFDLPLGWTLLGIGGFSVLYTTIGGIRADVFSDVLQLGVLVVALVICAVAAADAMGGLGPALALVPPERTSVLVLNRHGLGDGTTFAFLPMLTGGFFLYVSYYGFDQSQAQRLLSTRDVRSSQQALLLNGLLRFPLAALYCFLGLLLAAWLVYDPAFAAAHAGDRADEIVPRFLMSFTPPGIRGLFIAGLFAAAMSTLDSNFNSLSAVTLRDVLRRDREGHSLWLARGLSLLWGMFCTGSAFFFARSGETVIELVNRIGSLFYGPVLGLFLLGMLNRSATERAGLIGLGAGLATVTAVWRLAPDVSWMWWNPIGFGLTFGIGWLLSRHSPRVDVEPGLLWSRNAITEGTEPLPGTWWVALIGAFVALVALSAALPAFL
jgi:SSS family solute:Na+ symporter